MLTFQQGETIKVSVIVQTSAGAPGTPSAGVKITIKNPIGRIEVNSDAMTPQGTGIYDYYYNLALTVSIGQWSALCVAEDGGYFTRKQDYFEVKA